jgi:hypothetical protein
MPLKKLVTEKKRDQFLNHPTANQYAVINIYNINFVPSNSVTKWDFLYPFA